jgi:hypothetical protein
MVGEDRSDDATACRGWSRIYHRVIPRHRTIPAECCSESILVAGRRAVGRRRRPACRGGAVERHALDAAAAVILLLHVIIATNSRGPRPSDDFVREPSIPGCMTMNDDTEETSATQTTDVRRSSNRTAFILLAIIVAGAAAVALLVWYGAAVGEERFNIGLCTLVSMMLAALPLLISYAQTTTRDRQLAKLSSISDRPVADTAYYRVAVNALNAIKPATFDRHYTLPMITFCLLVLFSSLMVFIASFAMELFKEPSFILAGTLVFTKENSESIFAYQKGTYLAATASFIGSYVYVLGRLLDRVGNNDIYPISFYYYASRFVIACFVAIVFRHLLFMFGIRDSEAIVLIGFVAGLAPDLFILAMARRAFQMIKVPGSQNDPDQNVLPTSLNLLMIEGMSRDKIDRLNELGIDNAQILACQNPFMLWPRLPYDLGLIVDWISQAQLYRFAKETGTKALRQKGISNIFDLFMGLSDPDGDAAKETGELLGLTPSSIASRVASIGQDPCFRRLKEVRDKL